MAVCLDRFAKVEKVGIIQRMLDLKVQISSDWNINNARSKLMVRILRISI